MSITSKKLIIVEKPKMIPNIIAALPEAFEKASGYWVSDSYYLSSFCGHIVKLLLPEEYDEKYRIWKREHLPILPDPVLFRYDERHEARGKMLAKLASMSIGIIDATDPDREGAGIFWNWYNHEGINKDVERLWIPRTNSEEVLAAFKDLKPSEEYTGVMDAQAARAYADWVVGLNGSRAYSTDSGWSIFVGRVSSPVLKMIVDRDVAIENYTASYTYSVLIGWGGYVYILP